MRTDGAISMPTLLIMKTICVLVSPNQMYDPGNIVLLRLNCVVYKKQVRLVNTKIKSYFLKLLENIARVLESYFLRYAIHMVRWYSYNQAEARMRWIVLPTATERRILRC